MPLWKRKEIQEVLWTRKRIIPFAIVVFWLVMVGILLYREALLPYWYSKEETTHIMPPQDLWIGLFFGEEQRIGFVHLTTVPEMRQQEAGYAMSVLARLEIPLFSSEAKLQILGTVWQSLTTGLRNFDFHINADDHKMHLKGVVEEGVISMSLETAGEETAFTIPIGKEVLLSGNMGLGSMSLPALEPGEIAYVDAFDPTVMSVNKAKIEALRRETLLVGGEPVDTVVIATTIAGFTTKAWISGNAEVVRAETPVGLILKKITPEEAVQPLQPDESANMISALAIKPTGLVPNPDADRIYMRIVVTNPDIFPPEDYRQWREDEFFVVARQDINDMEGEELLSVEESAACLASDLFIQADSPTIMEQADAITGDAETPWEKAVLIYRWVYANIVKEPVLSVPSALDVLEQKTGDCNEHAVLMTALTRAVGIPTRVVIGLAWSESMQAFGYHAWVEVYTDRWIAMDPTFGEEIASPTHIKLLTGSIDQWPRLLSYIGAFSIEIVENQMNNNHKTLSEQKETP